MACEVQWAAPMDLELEIAKALSMFGVAKKPARPTNQYGKRQTIKGAKSGAMKMASTPPSGTGPSEPAQPAQTPQSHGVRPADRTGTLGGALAQQTGIKKKQSDDRAGVVSKDEQKKIDDLGGAEPAPEPGEGHSSRHKKSKGDGAVRDTSKSDQNVKAQLKRIDSGQDVDDELEFVLFEGIDWPY